MASVLLLGSGAAAFAETEGDDGEGDDGEPSGEGEIEGGVEPQLEGDGQMIEGPIEEVEPCEAVFGLGKFVVVFDDPEFDPADAQDQIDRLDVHVDVEGQDGSCVYSAEDGDVEGELWEPEGYDDLVDQISGWLDEDGPLEELQLSVEAAEFPRYDGVEHLAFVEHPLVVDAVPGSYRLEVDWNYQGVLPLSFSEPLEPWVWAIFFDPDNGDDDFAEISELAERGLETLDNGYVEDEREFFENVIGFLENPIVLGPVDATFDAAWFDADGDPADAPDEGWEMTLSSDGEVLLTVPGDEDETVQVARRADYTVAGEVPEDWELIDCPDDVAATATGVGDFNAGEQDVDHAVCVAEVEPEPEVVAIVDEEEEEETLPDTGVAPLGLLALGGAMTFAGIRMTRRRD